MHVYSFFYTIDARIKSEDVLFFCSMDAFEFHTVLNGAQNVLYMLRPSFGWITCLLIDVSCCYLVKVDADAKKQSKWITFFKKQYNNGGSNVTSVWLNSNVTSVWLNNNTRNTDYSREKVGFFTQRTILSFISVRSYCASSSLSLTDWGLCSSAVYC